MAHMDVKNVSSLHKNWYMCVVKVADYGFGIKIIVNKMADAKSSHFDISDNTGANYNN